MARNNRTLVLSEADRARCEAQLLRLDAPASVEAVRDRVLQQSLESAAPHLPDGCVDLLIADPPYNLDRDFGAARGKAMDLDAYAAYTEAWLLPLRRLLKPDASLYVCSHWEGSSAVHRVLDRHFRVHNRITWEREKGRGAKRNWKNASEDIWFATVGRDHYFDVDSVKLRRRVIAPYTQAGRPKDWQKDEHGGTRMTHPSNLWTDCTVPFWSMPENTPHPTQKPEKLLAKLILASCPAGGLVLDPFLGSGSTAAAARKLGRHVIGIEIDPEWALYAVRRLELAAEQPGIQGYDGDTFLDRNMG